MDFGLVLQTDPPAQTVIARMKEAEDLGISHGWTFDSTVLWQEPFVIYSQILAATSWMTVGPMVTNPLTRDWTVTASMFATLNEMFGNRTVCGIGRGDSARRVIGQKPASLATLGRAMRVIKDLAEGRETEVNDMPVRIPWVRNGKLEIWMAGYGPQGAAPGRGAGRRVHPADRRPGYRALDHGRGADRGQGGGPGPGPAHHVRGRPGLRRRRPGPPA